MVRVVWSQDFIDVDKVNFEKRFSNYIKCTKILDQNNDISNIIKRIGSSSQNGEVYLTKDNIAIKAIANSYPNEIEIAIHLSQLVLERRSCHFPVVFGYSRDKNFIFQNEKFNQVDRIANLLYSEASKCDLDQYIKSLTKEEFNLQKNYIYSQCMEAISDLHSVGICHNDLHLRNFLVLPYECKEGYIILITDFGTAEYRRVYQELDYEFFGTE